LPKRSRTRPQEQAARQGVHDGHHPKYLLLKRIGERGNIQ